MSIIERDGKKVIALRTLNQLGLIFLGLSYGNRSFVFFHLVSHAFFKSCIFIQVGFIISSSFGRQELRRYSFKLKLNPIRRLLLTRSLFRLLGLTFIRGFYSKELLLSLFVYYSNKRCTLLLVGVRVVFSFLYTSRILNILIDNKTNNCFNHSSSY